MKKLIVAFCCFPLIAGAQNFYASARVGMANYQGDMKAKSVSLSQSRVLFSLGARYDLSEHLTARTYFSLTSLHADDKNGTASMQTRNINFKTKIIDWELGAQYNFFSFNNQWWTPYIFAGIGFFRFNPYTNDSAGNKTYLKPLSTEGQGFMPGIKNYKLTQFSIPFGFGAEYSLNEDMRLGLEFGYRKIFTDYLDDVSGYYTDEAALLAARGQKAVDLAWRGDEKGGGPYPGPGNIRGNSKFNDAYYYVAITYTVRLVFDQYKEIAGLPAGKKGKRSGCPASKY
jgi:opacity protein-like surface antigen